MVNILVVDDDRNIRRMLAATLEPAGYRVVEADSAEQALKLSPEARAGLVLTDVRMAGMNGFRLLEELKRGDPALPVDNDDRLRLDSRRRRGDASRRLRLHFQAIHRRARAPRDRARAGTAKSARREPLAAQPYRAPFAAAVCSRWGRIAGKSRNSRRRSPPATRPCCLTGESGTGKSILAAHIHRLSPRKDGPFVEVSCTTLSEHLLESELFGHVRGSFTGAIKDKPGRLEAAHGGSVFLDEIGDLPTELQAKLLRFLQEKTFERVGGAETLEINARIIAATNQDLEQLVREKRFREDLYYRVNVIEIHVPPLRERPGEIVALAEHFIARAAEAHHKPALMLSDEARAALPSYSWPGNVRELKNLVERAVVLSRGDTITLSDLPDKVLATSRRDDQGSTLEELERRHIQLVLEQAVTLEEAADMLGINVATLWRKRRKYRLD